MTCVWSPLVVAPFQLSWWHTDTSFQFGSIWSANFSVGYKIYHLSLTLMRESVKHHWWPFLAPPMTPSATPLSCWWWCSHLMTPAAKLPLLTLSEFLLAGVSHWRGQPTLFSKHLLVIIIFSSCLMSKKLNEHAWTNLRSSSICRSFALDTYFLPTKMGLGAIIWPKKRSRKIGDLTLVRNGIYSCLLCEVANYHHSSFPYATTKPYPLR